MTVLTDTQVVTASGGLVELGYSQITSNVTVSSTTESAGTTVIPAMTVVSDGSPLSIEFFCSRVNIVAHGSGNYCLFNVVIDGTTLGRMGVLFNSATTALEMPAHLSYRTTLSAGSHTVAVTAMRYNANCVVNANGTAVGAEMPAFLRVSKIVQATQWPAVTTGTIICTSSTRPASPFAGQQIYETDTSREFTYVGTQWVPRDGIYATEALRDAAIPSPFEGQRAYITASTETTAVGIATAIPTGIQTIYNGAQWVCVTPVGARSDNGSSATMTAAYVNVTISGSLITSTLRTGTTALVSIAGTIAGGSNYTVLAVKTATVASDEINGAFNQSTAYITVGRTFIFTGLTAGLNTFTVQAKSNVISAVSWQAVSLSVQGIA